MKRRRKKSGKISIFFIFSIGCIAAYFWYQNSRYEYLINTPADPGNTAAESFLIKKGESVNEISDKLKKKNFILDQDAFKKYTKQSDNDKKIVAGRFMLSPSMTTPEIVEIITDRKQTELILTIPEGSTVADIDTKLSELEVIQSGDFMSAVKEFNLYTQYPFLNEEELKNLSYPLEGYLFPDTYYIDPTNFYPENLIQLMLNNFEKKLSDRLQEEHSRNIGDYIIMASIIEKEVNTSPDRPVVAGILWKRLDENWQIGADATLLYLKNDRTIDYNDLNEENPYNTRKNLGLPPGPICNPGLKSLEAAFYPKDSPYYYYLTDSKTGETIYARTNEEHNENKRVHL